MNNAFIPNVPGYPPTPAIGPSGHQSALKVVVAICALMFAALLGLVVLLLIGAETGLVELIIGMICATLPVPVYIMLILWLDRYESEPLWMLATAFFWGAVVAIFIALILNTINGFIVTVATHSRQIGQNFDLVISAPIVEESAKAFILLVLFLWKKDEFDGIVDGVVYAGMVGLGFAMTENILYYGRALQHGVNLGLCQQLALSPEWCSLTFVFVLRGMAAPFSHPLFTSMTGIGLGWSRQSNNGFVKVFVPVLGFMLAMLMHATWNGSGIYGGSIIRAIRPDTSPDLAALMGFVGMYFVIMAPVLVITLIIVFFSLRREGRIVRQFLYPDYKKGFFDSSEYQKLYTIRGRIGLSWNAMRTKGFSGWRTRMRCNQIASELAFHRSRVARGFARDPQLAQEREQAYLYTLYELRQKLGANVGR